VNRRNIALTALVLAIPVTAAVTQLASLNRSGFVGFAYFPAILLSVILGGGSLSPGPVPAWSSFVANTLVYLVVAVVLWALGCEIYLLRRGLKGLPRIDRSLSDAHNLTGESASHGTLERLGLAIKEIELRRRQNWLLEKTRSINLSDSPLLIGAKGIVSSDGNRPVKGVLTEFRRRLIDEGGQESADATLAKLTADAAEIVAREANRASRAPGQNSG